MYIPTLAFVARGGFAGPRLLFVLLILAVLGGIAAWVIRRRGTGRADRGSALEALQERFARGEIDQAEFEHRKAVLVGADVVPPPTGTAEREE